MPMPKRCRTGSSKNCGSARSCCDAKLGSAASGLTSSTYDPAEFQRKAVITAAGEFAPLCPIADAGLTARKGVQCGNQPFKIVATRQSCATARVTLGTPSMRPASNLSTFGEQVRRQVFDLNQRRPPFPPL